MSACNQEILSLSPQIQRDFDEPLEKSHQCLNSHCQSLINEIKYASENCISHLKRLERELLEDVEEYRFSTLNNCKTLFDGSILSENDNQRQLLELDSRVDLLLKRIKSLISFVGRKKRYLIIQGITDIKLEVQTIMSRIRMLRQQFRKQIFQGEPVSFNPRPTFCISSDFIGRLRFPSSTTDTSRRFASTRLEEYPLVPKLPKDIIFDFATLFHSGLLFCCSKTGHLCGIETDTSSPSDDEFEAQLSERHFSSICELPRECFALGDDSGCITLFRINPRKYSTFQVHRARVLSMLVLKDGRLASMSADNTIVVWNVFEGNNPEKKTVISGHGCLRFKYSHLRQFSNGFLVTCSNDSVPSVIRVWDPNSGRCVANKSTTTNEGCCSWTVSSDDLWVVMAFTDGSVRATSLLDTSSDCVFVESRSVNSFRDITSLFHLESLPNGDVLVINVHSHSTQAIQILKFTKSELVISQRLSLSKSNAILSCSLSADKQKLVLCYLNGRIEIWQFEQWHRLPLLAYNL